MLRKQQHRHTASRYFVQSIILIVLLAIVWRRVWKLPVQLPTALTIRQGDTPSSIAQQLWRFDATRLKLQLRFIPQTLKPLQVGTYQFSGSLSMSQFIQTINQWPATNYVRVTLLEGRSIYDMDVALTKGGFAEAGDYIDAATDPSLISVLSNTYPFLQSSVLGQTIDTLEGFLYPDTYFIDMSKPALEQIINLQLQNFGEKIRSPYLAWWASNLSVRLSTDGYNRVDLNPYQMLILATVVEKEERNADNKPTVAWVFINRIQQGMRLDADITLCYGLKQPYEICTPAFIAQGIYDTSNPYNTRQQSWLPPTPIANPSYKSVDALVNYKKTNNLFYLHDTKWRIYYGETVQDHNLNKSKYLNQ